MLSGDSSKSISTVKGTIMKIVTVLHIKFGGSTVDIGTDVIQSINLMNGGHELLLYYLGTEKQGLDHSQFFVWGVLTLLITWLPGTARVALKLYNRNWRSMKISGMLRTLADGIVLILIWPVFSALL